MIVSWASILNCQNKVVPAVFATYSINDLKMSVINIGVLLLLCPFLTTCRLSFPQVLELLCNKAQPHRCSAGLMGSLSSSWRRPGLSGDRAGRDGQKWGASCHDNRWGLLIGQGTREQTRLFFFFHHRDENKNTCLWICTPPAQMISPQSILVPSHVLYYLCLIFLFTAPC